MVLPFYENGYVTSTGPGRAFDIRRRIAHLLLGMGDHTAGRGQLQALLYDTERAYGPHHALPTELRRQLVHHQDVRGSR